jgi:hypothetical protein
MTFITSEIAAAFGFRDRILGIDAEGRRITLSRFRSVRSRRRLRRLECAYYSGWSEADHYCEREFSNGKASA